MLSGAGTDSDSVGGDVLFFSQRPNSIATTEKKKVGPMQSLQYVLISDKESWEKTLNRGKMHSNI